MTVKIDSASANDTERLGALVGASLRGGEVIELVSDLGGGKTTFVRGLARGAGASDQVSSPTFTLSNEYKASDFTIYHFDFYRIAEAGIMSDELAEVVGDPKVVVIVEWGEIVADVLPADKLTIKLLATSETSRQLEFSCPTSLKYLLPE